MSNIELPNVIAKYVQASNQRDLESLIQCFDDAATVYDEGEVLEGHSSISKWFLSTRAKYNFTTEPIAISKNGEDVILSAKVFGSFPNSPVILKYNFKLSKEKILNVKIA